MHQTQHLSWSSTKRRQKRASPLPRRRKTPKDPAPSGELVGLYDCAKKSKNYVELLNKYSEYESPSSADEVAKYLWPQQKDSKTEDQGSTGRPQYSRRTIKSSLATSTKDSTRKHGLQKTLRFWNSLGDDWNKEQNTTSDSWTKVEY